MDGQEEKRQAIMKDSEEYAKRSSISLNPNKQIVDAIVNGLIRNEERYGPGKRYCPCRPVMGNEKQDRKIICPCIYHMDEIKKDGLCHCRLFVRK
jgi:ferredoxin-thioredoxin reductase catalytic subunit